ncbi:MAG: hypothetical protein Q7S35_09930 [Candidatus Limnocylindrales bacterium]|nr:hypothetical protein [Candidatus Limnocylindrales bacterium]
MATIDSGYPSRRVWIAALSVLAGTAFLVACSAATSTAPPATTPVAALFIDADVVLGPKNLTEEEKPTKTCTQANRFAHNEDVVWRVKVVDPLTGKPMDDTTLASLQVKLPDQTLDLHYGGHPRVNPVDFFWTTSWVVPEGYPTGTVPYTVNATAKDGRTGTYEQFKVALAMLTVTDEVRAIIAEPTASPPPS